jgi:hypothetical protein
MRRETASGARLCGGWFRERLFQHGTGHVARYQPVPGRAYPSFL